MKKALLFCIIVASMAVHAQKVKSVKISESYAGILKCQHITELDSSEYQQILLFSQDNRYSRIIELIIVVQLSPKDAIDFFNEVEKFVTENEPETSMKVNDQTVYIYGSNKFAVYDIRGGSGFHMFSLKQWQLLKKDLNNYVLVNDL